ncbi:MAG: flagellar hook-length control protein FliK [candidate division Zixibacteria bacterium]|nr:flagellar hook-length control protein FliK [candidate division Zixibacteria bacterium]
MILPAPQNIDLLTAITATKPKLSQEAKANPFGVDFESALNSELDSELKSALREAPLIDVSLFDQPNLESQGIVASGAGQLSKIESLELESEKLFGMIDENTSEIISPLPRTNELALSAGLLESASVTSASDALLAQIVTGKTAVATTILPALSNATVDQRLFASLSSQLDSSIPITKDQESASASILKYSQVVSEYTESRGPESTVATGPEKQLQSPLQPALQPAVKPISKVNGDMFGNIENNNSTDKVTLSESFGKIDISKFSIQSQPTIALAPIRNLRQSLNEAKLATATSAGSAEITAEETFESRSIIAEQTSLTKNGAAESQGNLLTNKGATSEKIVSQKNASGIGQSFIAEIENITVSENASGKFDSSSVRTAQSTDGTGRMEAPSGVKLELPENLSSAIRKGASSISIKISPRNLGDAKLTLTIHQGIVSGTLFVESSAAKLAVESSLNSLIEKLAAEDITLDRLDVEVNDRERRGADPEGRKLFADSARGYSETEEGMTQDDQYEVDSARSLASGISGISSIAVDTFA